MYFIYIITNKTNTTLYTGVTNNLIQRLNQHKSKQNSGFTKRYNINKLVYFEEFREPQTAIAREKQIKAGSRQKKLDLINAMNPDWIDFHPLLIDEINMNKFTEARDEFLYKKK